MNFKVGGSFKMTFINFSTENGHSFGGEYLEIKSNELIKYTDRFDDPSLPGK
ncbi:SRPBCC domain-containing protein [Algoriphagus sp. D3-2-R+10]|uniref:SRPBCC domain-containing protein n=1 Tax=Algoriphagus aurantiacus TaxID=3103948 RepID=UPI003A5CB247